MTSRRRLVMGLLLALAADGGNAAAPATAAPQQPAADVCVDVKIGEDHSRYFDCLNRQMQRQTDNQANQQAVTQAAIANSQPQSPTQQGLYNQAATRERLGSSFGHSVVPERPKQNFVNPLIH